MRCMYWENSRVEWTIQTRLLIANIYVMLSANRQRPRSDAGIGKDRAKVDFALICNNHLHYSLFLTNVSPTSPQIALDTTQATH